jgi:hypothetical protein
MKNLTLGLMTFFALFTGAQASTNAFVYDCVGSSSEGSQVYAHVDMGKSTVEIFSRYPTFNSGEQTFTYGAPSSEGSMFPYDGTMTFWLYGGMELIINVEKMKGKLFVPGERKSIKLSCTKNN